MVGWLIDVVVGVLVRELEDQRGCGDSDLGTIDQKGVVCWLSGMSGDVALVPIVCLRLSPSRSLVCRQYSLP